MVTGFSLPYFAVGAISRLKSLFYLCVHDTKAAGQCILSHITCFDSIFYPFAQLYWHHVNIAFINLGRNFSFIYRVCIGHNFTLVIKYLYTNPMVCAHER